VVSNAVRVVDGLLRTVSESDAHPGNRAVEPNGRGRQRLTSGEIQERSRSTEQAVHGGSDAMVSPVGTAEWADAETHRVARSDLARTLEGKQSPRKERAVYGWQQSMPLRTRQRSKASRSRVVGKQLIHFFCVPKAQRRGGNGRSDADRRSRSNAAKAAGGGTSSRGVRCVAGKRRAHHRQSERRLSGRRGAASGGQATETRRTPSGTGMQQARNPCAEETVEVVRNHEDGTRLTDWHPSAEGGGNVTGSGCTGGLAGDRRASRGNPGRSEEGR
jgi:hypothetical protein